MDSFGNNFGLDMKRCQVFLFACPVTIPLSFASHPWFVVNKSGSLSRWEVLSRKVDHKSSWGHLYKDFFPPFQGIEILPFFRYFWQGRLLRKVEDEPAKQIAEFIEKSPSNYPYCNEYVAVGGPNSNTYVQWVLNEFPEFDVRLPWNSFGKEYQLYSM